MRKALLVLTGPDRRGGGEGGPRVRLGSEQALAPALASQRTFVEGACFKVQALTPTSSRYELFHST